MLHPSVSPIHRLVSAWWKSRPPSAFEINASRAALFEAATHEITANSNAGRAYDPLADNRFLWATQWLNHAEGSIRQIDPRIQQLAEVFLTPPLQPTQKELAAGPG